MHCYINEQNIVLRLLTLIENDNTGWDFESIQHLSLSESHLTWLDTMRKVQNVFIRGEIHTLHYMKLFRVIGLFRLSLCRKVRGSNSYLTSWLSSSIQQSLLLQRYSTRKNQILAFDNTLSYFKNFTHWLESWIWKSAF